MPSFCYLCGEPLAGKVPTNGDHCPPKGFFAPADRANFPIILPTHEACNYGWHKADELMSIVVDALHVKKKSTNTILTQMLNAKVVPFGQQEATAISNVPLAPIAARIVRAMHALLYNEFLPVTTKSKFHIPLPEEDSETQSMLIPLEQSFIFSGVVRKALITKTADVVRAYNDKFKYACTWQKFDNGTPFCIICFDIYAFHTLSPPVSDFPTAFVGMYVPERVPNCATYGSDIDIQLSQEELLNPWRQI